MSGIRTEKAKYVCQRTEASRTSRLVLVSTDDTATPESVGLVREEVSQLRHEPN